VGLERAAAYDRGMVALAKPDPPRQPRRWPPNPWWQRRPQVFLAIAIYLVIVVPALVLTSPFIAVARLIEKWRSKNS
jgi:hypothetical protein